MDAAHVEALESRRFPSAVMGVPFQTADMTANHAPSGTANTVTTGINIPYSLKTTDFGFTDPNDAPPNSLKAVKFTLLPTVGTLKDNGTTVTANQFVSVADISAGKLVFTPNSNLSGGPFFLCKFQVQDDGGTANGGVDLDPTAKVMNVKLVHVNHAPAGASKTVTTGLNVPYMLKAADFGFTDANDSPANALLAVKFTLLPTAGVLKDNGVTVTANQSVSVSDINSGKLIFTPNTNLLGGPFFLCKFQVQDNGGTANGGVDLDPVAKVMNVTIVRVNHAPAGTSGTVTTLEDTPYVLKTADFGFTDPNDNPANSFLAVKFVLLPSAGTLKFNGVAVTANQFVTAADISAGKLVFTPSDNLNGIALFLCKFQVEDNGGTANGGVDLDPVAKSLTIKITSVNDAPVGTSGTVTTSLNVPYAFKTADFGFSDPSDKPANSLLAVKISTMPLAGRLTDSGTVLSTGMFVPVADIVAGKLVFTPSTGGVGSPYASFTFQVRDNGGTANGGIDTDATARTMTINVTSGLNGGPESAVNTYTTGRQNQPDMAMDASGDYVIVWTSDGQDGSSTGIFARRYNAAGTPQGSEFQVNTFSIGFQVTPSVAMDANGNFVVTWQSDGPSGTGIRAQRFNAAGVAQGSEFTVNSSSSTGQNNPSVAMDSTGDFVITWTSYSQDGSGNGIFARRFNAAAAPQGNEFQVNIYTTGSQESSSVAMDSNGDFVIVWDGLGANSSTNNQIYLRRFSSSGVGGGEVGISTATTVNQQSPAVAMDASGDFVVTWFNANQDGDGNGVFAQRFAASSSPQGGVFRVNTYTTNNQSQPSVAMDSSGDFVVTWRSYGQAGNGYAIYAQRYDSSGNASGGEFKISQALSTGQSLPRVSLDANGDEMVFAWASYNQDGSSYGIYARRFAPS